MEVEGIGVEVKMEGGATMRKRLRRIASPACCENCSRWVIKWFFGVGIDL